MDVLLENFNEVLPEIEQSAQNCTFLAIDCEFSGLHENYEINAYDTPKQYYEKMRKNCSKFLLIQYGVCFFRLDEEGVFRHKSYNFYIFRKPIKGNIPDQAFLCQTSSMNFLIRQGFDFNKVFEYGIPYLNISEENACKESIERKEKNLQITQNLDPIPIPDESKNFISDIVKTLKAFLANANEEELYLPKCNAFMRRLIYQTVEKKFKTKILLTTVEKDSNRVLLAVKLKGDEDLQSKQKKMIDEEKQIMENFIGFSKVIKILSNSGKLVVGHNMCLDFIHTIDKFITPLPEDYEEFKECAHSLFTDIVDTKYMSNSEPFKDCIQSTVLLDLLDTMRKSPFELPKLAVEENSDSYGLDDQKGHEAGYDAFVTGVVFSAMWKHLADSQETDFDISLLKPYINRLCLISLRDKQYINLEGEDPKPKRDHVFHLTFPKEWKSSNITQLFSPFGNVHLAWINDTSAYVGLYKKEQATIALNTLSQSDIYAIKTYDQRQIEVASSRGRSSMNTIASPAPAPAPAPSHSKQKRSKNDSGSNQSKKIKSNKKTNSSSKSFDTIVEEHQEEAKFEEQIIKKKKKTFPETDWD